MRVLVSAGEASGEVYGAQLVCALKKLSPHVECFGVGGERMREAGFDVVVEAHDVAVVGLVEVASHLPRIWRRFHDVLRAADARRPDVAVLIDFPDFNLRLAKELHRRGIPVVYYISPQLWAWRASRVEQIRRYVRKVLVIFPFEVEFYKRHGVEAEFVGHPLADEVAIAADGKPLLTREQFAAKHKLHSAWPWIALLPGSRRREVALNAPAMMMAAMTLGQRYEFIVPVASTLSVAEVGTILAQRTGEQARKGAMEAGKYSASLRLTRDVRGALAHARAAVVASGTATVEAALMNTPMVVVYRVAALSWAMGRRLVRVPHFAMVNLIASGWQGSPAEYAS